MNWPFNKIKSCAISVARLFLLLTLKRDGRQQLTITKPKKFTYRKLDSSQPKPPPFGPPSQAKSKSKNFRCLFSSGPVVMFTWKRAFLVRPRPRHLSGCGCSAASCEIPPIPEMKFAEHLTAHITPEWRKQYINYEVSAENRRLKVQKNMYPWDTRTSVLFPLSLCQLWRHVPHQLWHPTVKR